MDSVDDGILIELFNRLNGEGQRLLMAALYDGPGPTCRVFSCYSMHRWRKGGRIESGVCALYRGVWRRGSESNRRTRLCRPLHDHSATPPGAHKRTGKRNIKRFRSTASCTRAGYAPLSRNLERERSLELPTSTLARLLIPCTTTSNAIIIHGYARCCEQLPGIVFW